MTLKLQADVGRAKAVDRRRRNNQIRVSFSGLDGAGKSSQIEALVAGLGSERRSTQVLWLPFHYWPRSAKVAVPRRLLTRLWPKDPQRPRAEAVVPRPVESTGTRPQSPKKQAKAMSGLRSSAMAVTGTAAAISAGLSLRRRMAAGDADVLVLDRYCLDSLVKLRYAFPDLSQAWLARILRSVAPKPDLEFHFRIDPEVAYARKPAQWNVDQLTVQARLYDELTTTSSTVVTLDAARHPDDVARDVWARVKPLLDGR